MTEKDSARIIRERVSPSVFDFSYIATRAHRHALKRFVALLCAAQKKSGAPFAVLDCGCGYKPFQKVLAHAADIHEYVGVDYDRSRSYADIEASVESLPISDDHFDAVLATEILEHVRDARTAVSEMRRVAKDGALVYVSTPFVFPEHGIPYDFSRFTRYALHDLFVSDHVLAIIPTNTSVATPFYLCNVCWKSMTILERIPVITPLVYAINNICGLLCELLTRCAAWCGRRIYRTRAQWFADCFENYFYRMPASYDMIVKIRK